MKTQPDDPNGSDEALNPPKPPNPADAIDQIDQIAQEILADMPLREKSAIARLEETEIPYLQYAFDHCVSTQIGMSAEMSRDVVHRIWRELRATHRLRVLI